MHAFQYEAPSTLQQALGILTAHGDKARPFVGGTDIIIQMRAGVRRPDYLVDVKQIRELRELSYDAKAGQRLGAAVSCIEFFENPAMRQIYPGLCEAAHLIGSLQIQNRASIGGNLCNGSPAADTTPALIALGARARLASSKGEREVAVEKVCTGPGRTLIEPGELLVQILIPPPAAHSADAYLRFIPRNEMDIAVVGVGTALTLDGERVTAAKIALGAVGPTQIVATRAAESLIGKRLDEGALAAAARLASEAATPIDDMRGTTEFRMHVTGVLTRRTITIAADRARKK